jgi:hypothetical protein
MASQVEIVNRALLKLGGNPITSISDNSQAARVMSGLWETVRKSEMTKRYWTFALSRAALAALGTPPDWGYDLQYQLPVDYLKIVQVHDIFIPPSFQDYVNADNSPYSIEGKRILTDFGAPLKIRYVRDVTDPGEFDPLFAEVMASKLAYEACYAITQSLQGREQMDRDYNRAIRDAGLNNAISKPPQSVPDDSWMLGRL